MNDRKKERLEGRAERKLGRAARKEVRAGESTKRSTKLKAKAGKLLKKAMSGTNVDDAYSTEKSIAEAKKAVKGGKKAVRGAKKATRKGIRIAEKVGRKLAKKSMSGVNYDDVYSTRKDSKGISKKRGERIIKKAKKKGVVTKQTTDFKDGLQPMETTTATKGRKTVTKTTVKRGEGKDSSQYTLSKQQTNAGKKRRIKKINKKSKKAMDKLSGNMSKAMRG